MIDTHTTSARVALPAFLRLGCSPFCLVDHIPSRGKSRLFGLGSEKLRDCVCVFFSIWYIATMDLTATTTLSTYPPLERYIHIIEFSARACKWKKLSIYLIHHYRCDINVYATEVTMKRERERDNEVQLMRQIKAYPTLFCLSVSLSPFSLSSGHRHDI